MPIGSVRAGIVGGGGDAIPDSAIAQYDFREEDGTLPITDQSNSGNDLDTGSYSGVSTTINGQQAGDFNTGDSGVYTTSLGTTTNQPIVVYTVYRIDTVDISAIFSAWDSTAGDGFEFSIRNTDEYFVYAGQFGVRNYFASTGTFIHTAIFDGASSEGRLNGTSEATGDAGSNVINAEMGLGNSVPSEGDDAPFQGAIGFCEVHNGFPTNGVQTREQEIADSWGIVI